MTDVSEKIIVALDTQSSEHMHKLITELKSDVKFVKVGMQAFYTFGIDLISKLKEYDYKIFLDLKLHDIPTTVSKTLSVLGKYDIDMINVHAAGGFEMLKSAVDSYKSINDKGKLIAVTQLTSTNKEILNHELLIPKSIDETVYSYAQMSYKAGLDGVVASALEVPSIKKIDQNFLCITPGIRPTNLNDDQKRIVTPKKALELGSDYLVIGRPITKASNPLESFKNIIKEL